METDAFLEFDIEAAFDIATFFEFDIEACCETRKFEKDIDLEMAIDLLTEVLAPCDVGTLVEIETAEVEGVAEAD